jgi:hypothetical protein
MKRRIRFVMDGRPTLWAKRSRIRLRLRLWTRSMNPSYLAEPPSPGMLGQSAGAVK